MTTKTLLSLPLLLGALLAPSPLRAQTSAAATPASLAGEQLLSLTTREFRAQVSSLGGGLRRFELLDPRFAEAGSPTDLVTTDKPDFYPLGLRVAGMALAGAEHRLERVSERAVRVRVRADGVGIERKLEAGAGPYQLWLTTTVASYDRSPRKLRVSEVAYHYVRRRDESGGVPILPARSSAISNALCRHGGGLEREPRTELSPALTFPGPVRFAGIENVYFVKAVAAVDDKAARCRMQASDRGRDAAGDPLGTLFSAELEHAELTLAPGQKVTLRALAYLGPKTPAELSRAGHALRESIDSGFFTALADMLTSTLRVIHGGVGNWGVAIILLTFLVKLVLYPLTHKQMESMARMKELKPEMDRINELYADDREKKGAAVMELYRKKGVNPMAGCFPVLLQLPIWFSLYAALSSDIQLLHAPFALWWRDLSSPDPYFVLPLALGVLMFVQQKLAPQAGADPLQAKMMLYMMPAMITSFMLFLPAGLCLYMFTNSALSIVQQRFIEARLASQPPKAAVVASASASPAPEIEARASTPERRRLRRGRK